MSDRPIPPPALVALTAAAQYALCRGGCSARGSRGPGAVRSPSRERVALTMLLGAVSAGLFTAAARELRRHETTILPTNPGRATALVTTGVYRHTRNPIYLADVLALLGFAAWLGRPRALLPVAGLAITLQEYQIRAEEQALSTAFGRSYEEYAGTVRRWL